MNQEKEEILKRHCIAGSANVREAIAHINSLSGSTMTLFAMDDSGNMTGTVTDGDIRRALISGVTMDDSVDKVMHREFLHAGPGDNLALVIEEGRRRRIDLLPVLDNGVIIDVLDLRKLKTSLPIDAILMAGGRGERLRPLTDKTPKPLLPVGGKAIIDYNVEELESCGVETIFVTVNYLAEQIQNHFESRKGSAKVKCVLEPSRLGTIGSVALVDGLTKENILLMNSDLLTTIDFEAMYLHHMRSGDGITMAAVPWSVSVPYALMTLEDDKVKGLAEKPTFNYFANAGVYLIKRELLTRIRKGECLDAPDFISDYIADGGEVGCFPIEGTWIDIGSPNDYRYADELMARKLPK